MSTPPEVLKRVRISEDATLVALREILLEIITEQPGIRHWDVSREDIRRRLDRPVLISSLDLHHAFVELEALGLAMTAGVSRERRWFPIGREHVHSTDDS